MRIIIIIKIVKTVLFYLFSFIFYKSLCFAEINEVNIYSARQEILMRELINNFEKKENIKVNIIFSKANQLIKKLEMEGKYTKADILLTVDVARLIKAKNNGLFKRIDSDILQNKFHLFIEIKIINGLE